MAVRMLKVAKNVTDNIIPVIDDSNVLGLRSPFDRCDLFVLAMSLGIHKNEKNAASSKGIALVRETSVSTKNNAYITSLLIKNLQETGELEKIADKDVAYIFAQDYADVGFKELNELADRINKSSQKKEEKEDIIWDMLAELDDTYDELFSEDEL